MSKHLIAKTTIIRCVKPGRPATDKRPAVAAEFETIQPGTHFVAKSASEAEYLIESGAAVVNASKADSGNPDPGPENGKGKKGKKKGAAATGADDEAAGADDETAGAEGDEVL